MSERYRIKRVRPGIVYEFRYAKTLESAEKTASNLLLKEKIESLVPNKCVIEVTTTEPNFRRICVWEFVKEITKSDLAS